MNIKIPQTWLEALAHVQAIAPEAVIGGGCLRDLDNGREVKDIDIFIPGMTASALDVVRDKLNDGGFNAEEIDSEKLYPVGDGNDVVGHFEVMFDGIDVPVQIIMVDFDCSRIVERFDYGICRLAHDGTTLTVSDDYLADKKAEVFRLRRQRSDAEMVASVHRFARLSAKYPGWRFELFARDDEFDVL